MSDVPDGMVEMWTIEKPVGTDGVFIDDIVDSEPEALAEVQRRGEPWTTTRLVVPYREPPDA